MTLEGNARSRLVLIVLLVLTVGSFFVNFWGWDLWAPDEPRYAEVARETLEDGHWLVPYLGGEPYADKPPLYFWLLAGSYAAFGMTPFAVRILPVLSASATILVTYFLGRRLFNRRAGLFAAIVLGTSVLFMDLGRHGNIDATLTLLTTGALALFFLAHHESKRRLWLPAYGLMALGALMKGPVAFLLPMHVFIFYLLVIGKGKSIRRMRLIPGLGILAVMLAAWLVPAALDGGPDYTRTILLRQNVGRVVASFSHAKPFYYYLKSFPPNFLPWIVFLPQAVYLCVRRRTPQKLLPVVWFATIFVFFSIMSGKRGLYLLPLFPAAALLVGVFFDACLSRAMPRSALSVPAVVLAVLLVALAGALCFLRRLVEVPDYLEAPARLLWMAAAVLGAGGAVLLGAVAARRHAAVLPTVCVTMLALALVMTLAIFPAMNANKTARFICEDLLRARTGGEPVVLYNDESRSGAYHFYTRLPLVDIAEEGELIKRLGTGEKTYVILSEENYTRLGPETTAGWQRVAARQVGHRSMRVFCSGGVEIEPEQ
jgi:4-amino-4-deoxy-L-arabinose transferase-like glycosyltransferase